MKHIYSILLLLIVNQTLYGQQASALNFDGVNDAIDCGNLSALDITGTSLTLEAIITLDGNGTIISKEQSSAAGYILRQDADGKISFFIGSSGTWYGVSTTMAISTGVKYHIAATYDGSNLKIYLDGVETANSPTTASITSSTSNLTIGDWPLGGRNINATIDDIRIWNVTRTIAEISANMSTDLTLPETGLVAYYKFNQGVVNADNSSETTLLDATSNTLNGTLNNFALTGSTSNWTGIAVTSVPTTNFTTQIYTGDDKDLDDLQVTGTGIQWYAAASGGAVIPSTTLLTDGTTYYASQTIAGVESTERLAITVNRISDNTQTFSAGATVADLVSTPSTGATATWYTSANGGIALADTDALSVGTYYVEEITLETIESLSSGFSSPRGVAVQSDGKILIADSGNDAIKRMNADGTGIEILGSGFNEPWSISIQPDGKLLVADTNNHIIKRMNADGTGIEALGSGLFWPISVDVQTDGKILIADFGNEVIKRMNADGSNIETLGFGFNLPYDAVVQSDGKILIADAGNDAIKRMNADGTNIEILASGFSDLFGLDIQSDGKILAATNFTSNDIKRVSVDGTVIENLGSGFNSPSGVAVQTDGKILIADSGNNAIKRFTEAYTSNRVAVVVEEQVTAVPTTIYPTQIYTGDDKDLDDLQVTGTGIQWYAAATGNTTLPNSTLLADGTTYYASQTIAGVESTERLAITVNRISDNTQNYSPGDTVADLGSTPSTGATATWYTSASSSTALTNTEVLSAGTYYVDETTPEIIETLGSGSFVSPFGVGVQSDGKIVLSSGAIWRMNANGTGIEILNTGFAGANGIAIQSDDKIVVADNINSTINRINADGSNTEPLGLGFSNPSDVAIQSDGKILVADTGNNAIKRMNADGTAIETLGTGFNSPRGIVVQPDGKILVADTGNNAIKRMNADGAVIETLGLGFNNPRGVVIQLDGKILVADTGNNAIKRMNADGTVIETLGTGFNNPIGVAVQSDGKILVADTGNNAIRRITEAYTSNRVAVIVEQQPTLAPTTTYPTQIYTGDDKDLDDLQVTGTGIQWYASATGNTTLSNTTLLADGTTYYASQTLGSIESTARLAITVNRISDNIQEFSSGDTVADLVSTPSTGVTATWYTTASDGTALTGVDVLSAGTYYVEEIRLETLETLGAGFSNPFGVAVQSDGKILVADSNNNTIKRMNADGTGIEILGNGFNFSYSIAVQSDGKILVADTFNNAIKRMNEDGTGIETLGSGFLNPTGVAVQSDGKILVADSNNNGIKRMNADGTGIEILGSGFNSLIGVAVQSDGKILVADIGDNAIKRMNADGSNIETLGTGFLAPYGAAVQSDGKILVADTGNNEIKRMNADGTGIEVLSSSVFNPSSIALQSDGKILAADPVNSSIRRITEAYTSNRVAVTVSETLSIDDVDINNSLLLYPNPAKDKLFITTSNGLLIKSITLIDALGRNVFTVDKQNVIDVSNISNGVLLLKIKTNKGTITKRVVKQ